MEAEKGSFVVAMITLMRNLPQNREKIRFLKSYSEFSPPLD